MDVLESYEPLIKERVDALCKTMMENASADGWSPTRDMGRWCTNTPLTLSIT